MAAFTRYREASERSTMDLWSLFFLQSKVLYHVKGKSLRYWSSRVTSIRWEVHSRTYFASPFSTDTFDLDSSPCIPPTLSWTENGVGSFRLFLRQGNDRCWCLRFWVPNEWKDTLACIRPPGSRLAHRCRGCTFLHCLIDGGVELTPQSWQSACHLSVTRASLP